jgi:hypothetical protein
LDFTVAPLLRERLAISLETTQALLAEENVDFKKPA